MKEESGHVAEKLLPKMGINIPKEPCTMRLHAYLTRNGIRVDDFAIAIGVSSLSTIYRYMRGERIPCSRTMERIRELSGGAVTADVFFRSREWWLTRRARELGAASTGSPAWA